MILPLRVLGARVLIKPDIDVIAPEQTDSGLLTAATMAAAVEGEDKEVSYTSGTVVSIGNPWSCPKCGRIKTDFNVGDRVTFSWKSGQEVVLNHETYVVMRSDDVLAVLESPQTAWTRDKDTGLYD